MQQMVLGSSARFFTLEKRCVKFWEFCHGQTELIKKIHIKQDMI